MGKYNVKTLNVQRYKGPNRGTSTVLGFYRSICSEMRTHFTEMSMGLNENDIWEVLNKQKIFLDLSTITQDLDYEGIVVELIGEELIRCDTPLKHKEFSIIFRIDITFMDRCIIF
jgi:hypothetical protein